MNRTLVYASLHTREPLLSTSRLSICLSCYIDPPSLSPGASSIHTFRQTPRSRHHLPSLAPSKRSVSTQTLSTADLPPSSRKQASPQAKITRAQLMEFHAEQFREWQEFKRRQQSRGQKVVKLRDMGQADHQQEEMSKRAWGKLGLSPPVVPTQQPSKSILLPLGGLLMTRAENPPLTKQYEGHLLKKSSTIAADTLLHNGIFNGPVRRSR